MNYILFGIFVVFTFLVAFLTIKAQKENIQIIRNSTTILLFISFYSLLLFMLIIYAIFSGKIYKMLGIDFVGGTLTEITINKNVTDEQIQQVYKKNGIEVTIQEVILPDQKENQRTIALKTKPIEETLKNQINNELKSLGAEIRKSENISATIGKETLINALIALIIALIAQIIYIAFRFGNNILYGIIADIGLIHDVLVMLGVYVILGMMGFAGFEINSIFLAAVLTVVGYSVMDTIIIFDRIRENLKIEIKQNKKVSLEKFDIIINNSIIQTLVRSVFTTFTVLLTLWGIIFLGGETLRSFSIALAVGTFSGAFSSIFIAAPLVSVFKNKILSKDVKLLDEEEKPKQAQALAENIMKIFAHQQENPEESIQNQEDIQNQKNVEIEVDKDPQRADSSKGTINRYLKTRLIKKQKNK